MIYIFNESFDKSEYPRTPVAQFENGNKVSVAGTISISKKNCSSGPMFSCTMTRRDGRIGISVFPEDALFAFVEAMPPTCDAVVYGVVSVNGKYINVTPENIEFYTEASLPATEFDIETSELYAALMSYVNEIKDDFLRNVALAIYGNEKIMRRFLMAPASEFSSGSYLGGLASLTLDTCKLAHHLCMSTDESAPNLGVNADMILTAILLCNIGRAYMYDITQDGKYYKNEYATLDTDTALTRDTVRNVIKDVLSLRTEDGERMYSPKTPDVIKELIHMLDSSKSMISLNPAMTPRTRNASILSFIIGLMNAVGTYNKLDDSNLANDKLVRAFDGGKSYFLPELWPVTVEDQTE